jgi:hypothetical protein
MFALGVGFCMFSIFFFTLFVFTLKIWTNMTLFAVVNTILNTHFFFSISGVLWASEATVKEEKKSVKLLYQFLMQSDDAFTNDMVSLSVFLQKP